MVIVGFIFTFLFKAGFDTLVSVYGQDKIKVFLTYVGICIFILVVLGFCLVKFENKLACYLICLDVLDELENEWNDNNTTKGKNNFSQIAETMNQAIKDADETIKKAYESLEEVNRNAKFLEYMTIRGTKK